MNNKPTFLRARHALPAFAAALIFVIGSGVALAVAPAAHAADDTMVLYNGQHEQMANLLVSAFEKDTGIHVEVRNGESPELANTLIAEGRHTPADVFLSENSPEVERLQEKGLLAPVDPATLKQIPARYSSGKGDWVGIVARENVLTWNPHLIKKSELPKSILDLARPKWKGKIAIHLTSNDIMPLIRTISVKDGRAEALKWVEGIKRNAKLFQSSPGVVAAVNRGGVAIGISNSYYYYRLRAALGKDHMVSRVYHFEHGDPGGLINVSGAAVLKYARHPRLAQKFLAFAVSRKAQTVLAKSDVDFEYPLRPGVAANPALKPFDQLEPPHMTVEQLGTNREALSLLQEAGAL